MWVAIVGSRDLGECPCSKTPKHFPPTQEEKEHAKRCPIMVEWQRMLDIVTRLAARPDFDGIVSGECPTGADALAKRACRILSVPYLGFPPKPGPEPFWQRAHARNQRIVNHSGMVVAVFSPGPRSPGTSDTLGRALSRGIPAHVYHSGRWSSE